MTRAYLVLRESEGLWTTAAQVEANGAEQAVRQVAANGDGGLYAAVPERNFSRIRATVVPAKPRIVLEVER